MEKPDRPERGAQKIFNIVDPPSNTKKARRITLRNISRFCLASWWRQRLSRSLLQ
jgi:hypothetical protein